MIIDFKQIVSRLDKVRSGEIKEGEKIDVPEIDEYLRYKESNFNVVLGHANVGKTTVILYLMLVYAKRIKKRWLVFSSENEPHSIVRKLVEFLEMKPINKIEQSDYEKQCEFINSHFKIVDCSSLYTYRSLIELAKAIKNAWEYHGMLIDPYNSLIKDPEMTKNIGGHEYDYQACSEIRLFAKKYKITVWLNTHANTNALRVKHPIGHDYVGHPIPPLASDVEGGGKFVNRADDFLVIHRYIQHPTEWMFSHIHVRKVKEIETGGRPTPIDEPIKMRSMKGNVGFEINNKPILDIPIREQSNLPF